MRSYRLSHPARADLDAIWLHIAQNAGVDTADRFIDTLTNRLPMLAEMPEAGRSADEIEPGVRVFPVENCRLVSLPLGEDQAMLDPHNLQHAVEVESRRLDLGADLFLGHSLGFV